MSWIGRVLCRIEELRTRGRISGTWIDVGAHHGEHTLVQAQRNPRLRVYAVEPNLRAALKLAGQAPNFFVVPMAVAEQNGCADFHLNAFEEASSLLPFDEKGLRSWVGQPLKVDSIITVPTIRLDTLMDLLEMKKVDFLKIDTQGMDLGVLKSAGSRLRDIRKITMEVWISPVPLYAGAASREEVCKFLDEAGFELVSAERQNHDQEENLTFVLRHSPSTGLPGLSNYQE